MYSTKKQLYSIPIQHEMIKLKVEMMDGCCITLSPIFERFAEASPITVMLRATLERIFSAEQLDEIFEATREKQ
ncbi:hypothetical protein [Nostoc sp.]|uniref:hypothetical protein n=1 Tax=Nostoc sp. TaxID=1180 RepID=UPI002FF6E88F